MKPIIMSTEDVRALLDGRKTMARLVIKPQPISENSLTYGVFGDTIQAYHKKGVNGYVRNQTGEWRCINANTGITERGLQGGVGRNDLLPDEVLRLWEKGFCGLVCLEGFYDKEGLSVSINEPQQHQGNEVCTQPDMLGVSWTSATKADASKAPGRESIEQRPEQSCVGDSSGELAGQENTRDSKCRGETLECETDGRGTGTRQMDVKERALQPKTDGKEDGNLTGCYMSHCPFRPGQIMWVRETWCVIADLPEWTEYKYENGASPNPGEYCYKAGSTKIDPNVKWRSPVTMPREAARLFLRVKDVRVERVQDIFASPPGPNSQVVKEGFEFGCDFIAAWNNKNDKRGYGWDTNPFCWVIEFERIEKGAES